MFSVGVHVLICEHIPVYTHCLLKLCLLKTFWREDVCQKESNVSDKVNNARVEKRPLRPPLGPAGAWERGGPSVIRTN